MSNERVLSFELSIEEANVLALSMDVAIKANGLQIAKDIVPVANRLIEAVRKANEAKSQEDIDDFSS